MREALAGIVVTLLCAGLYLYPPQVAVNLDYQVFDAFAGWAGRGRSSGRVVIVEVDDASLAGHGRWPWPRDRVALLVSRILEHGADTVATDLMFTEPDVGDSALAAAIVGRKVVVGYYFGFQPRAGGGECPLHPAFLLDSAPGVFRATSVLCSRPEISRAAAATGFLNATPDGDGLLRRVPLLI